MNLTRLLLAYGYFRILIIFYLLLVENRKYSEVVYLAKLEAADSWSHFCNVRILNSRVCLINLGIVFKHAFYSVMLKNLSS